MFLRERERVSVLRDLVSQRKGFCLEIEFLSGDTVCVL